MRHLTIYILIMLISGYPLTHARAEIPPSSPAMSREDKAALARQLMSRIAKRFSDADREMKFAQDPVAAQIANLPEDESLLLQIQLQDELMLETPVLAQVKDGDLLVSLRDLMLALEFPIEVNMQAGTAQGWYIREENIFLLNIQNRNVKIKGKDFTFSPSVIVEDTDILVPYKEVSQWFGLTMKPNISDLNVALKSQEPLPVEGRLARKNTRPRKGGYGEPVQPALKDENPARAVPLVDVSTSTSYTKPGDENEGGEKGIASTAYIRTAGDLAGGTLVTQTSLDNKEKLTNFRATFSEQSLEDNLLGPLKARRYEIGDVFAPSIPLRVRNNAGVGARVSNISANRTTLQPFTEIRGTTFPNWDVELYRDNQLLGVQTVGDDGVYAFENIDLYSNSNNFRVVLYGPQGERREEEVIIPVDTKRLSRSSSAYDIAVISQDQQIYRKQDLSPDDKDTGEGAVTAVYEMPIGEFSAATAGFEAGSDAGEQVYAAHAGLSSVVGGTLLNLDTAVDQNNETAAQLVVRRDIGQHKLRNETKVNTEKYALTSNENSNIDVLSNRFSVNGPLPFGLGSRPRYNLGLGFGSKVSGDLSQTYLAGYSDSFFKRLTFNQQLNSTNTGREDDEQELTSLTSLAGSLGKNRLRLSANYEIKPQSELDLIQADYTRDLNKVLDFNLNVRHRNEPAITEGRAQLDWRAGFADISPSISYNTDNEMIAMLNTRFGLAHDPLSKEVKTFEDAITANGGVSAFVFLDKNGDNIFNEGDEPIQDAVVKAPQNGGEEITDETGHVFFNRLINMRPTDIFVQEDSLADPYWVTASNGYSIIPREGHVVGIEFPVHIGGEIDGTVYVRSGDGSVSSLRGIKLSLYDFKGKKVKSTTTETDGFYVLDKVPPGRYMLVVDNDTFDGPYARPKPQPILIKSSGSAIYANDIYMHEGTPDVKVVFYDSAHSLKLDPSALRGRGVFLNLGQYKSQLTLGLAWFKVRNLFKKEMAEMELLQQPSESLPDEKTNSYALRLFSFSDDMSEAYNKCKVLNANGQKCTVEVVQEKSPQIAAIQ